MTDTTWAAKVLESVPRLDYSSDVDLGHLQPKEDGSFIPYADALAAIAKLGDGEGLVERISEPHDPGDFVGDIYYGHPFKTTMGTHRWTGTEWVALPSEAEALAGLLAEVRNEAAARIAALTAQNRELALDVLASSGQAQDAYAAQIAAEAESDALRAKVADHEKAAQENDPSNLWRFWAGKAKEIADSNTDLRARVARLEGALRRVKNLPDEIEQQVKVTREYAAESGMDRNQVELMNICTSHFLDAARQLRAALTEGTPE